MSHAVSPSRRRLSDSSERGISLARLARRLLPRNIHWRAGHRNARGHQQSTRLYLELLIESGGSALSTPQDQLR